MAKINLKIADPSVDIIIQRVYDKDIKTNGGGKDGRECVSDICESGFCPRRR